MKAPPADALIRAIIRKLGLLLRDYPDDKETANIIELCKDHVEIEYFMPDNRLIVSIEQWKVLEKEYGFEWVRKNLFLNTAIIGGTDDWLPLSAAPKGYTEGNGFEHILFKGHSKAGSFSGNVYVSGWMDHEYKPVYEYAYKLVITGWKPLTCIERKRA